MSVPNLHSIRILLAAGSLALGVSCSTKKVQIPVSSVSPVSTYCPHIPSLTFSSSVTISGSAKYEYRNDGNEIVNPTPANIRYAEVEVRDSSGAIVQCAETDASGNFSFQLPANSGSYTVKVNSRANNSTVKAYVMNNPTDNTYYSLSTTVSSDSDGSVALTAPATGSVLGGAFNILDKIVDANLFLSTYAGSGPCAPFSDCPAFTVAPLSYVYWTKGFNPNTYLRGGSSTSGVSFFLKGTNELYILGGIEGDVDSSDCDHFDNSIILHEYGHFIESHYSVSNSPGGRHAPNEVIDPRLAWSEGFANFFQAAVTGRAIYRDTEGNVSCGSGCTQAFHNESLENFEAYDDPVYITAGEGNFHEFSISRLLWDALDPHPVTDVGGPSDPTADADGVVSPFAEIWTVFAGTSSGFKSSALRFRNIGLFHKLQSALTGKTDWTSLRTAEKQINTLTDYATPLTVPGVCGATNMTIKKGTNGSFEDSNLYYDNDFYAYYHTSGTLNVRVAYTPGATPADIDLIIWKDGYVYGASADALTSSRQSRAADGGDEEITIVAPAGWYMINVMGLPYSTSAGGSATYTLYIGGNQACATP